MSVGSSGLFSLSPLPFRTGNELAVLKGGGGDMEVKGLIFVGTRTDRFEETRTFFKEVMGLSAVVDRHDFVIFRLPNEDVVEVFGPSDRDHTFFTGPAVGLLVEDIETARAEMEAAGIEFIGPTKSTESGKAWAYFRGPDENVYEITTGFAAPPGVGTEA
jgi:catechol 2,3-dioxygenase-like lactoylglutathione lyase family enzyme